MSFLSGRLRVKIFAALIAVLTVFFILIASMSEPLLFYVFTRNTYATLSEVASAIDYLVPDTSTYYYDLYALAQNYGINFEIVNSDGYLLYRSGGTGSATGIDHFASSGSVKTEYSEMVASTKYPENKFDYPNFEIKKKIATNADFFIYHLEISTGDTAYVFYPVADVENIVSVADTVYSVFSILIVALLGVIFFLLVSKLTKPIVEMNDITRNMAALNFDRKCKNYGADEIGELGRSINTLSDKLDDTLLDLNDKNRQLEKDIEMRLALDNARKSFISNVSHELKTPLAIISGYAEGLKEGLSDDPETIKEYCGIIMDESSKMNELVLELLELSKLDSKTQDFRPDYYDIGESIARLIDHLSLRIKENGITVKNNIPLSLECFAEEDKIETVLGNYITNAISHCEGKKEIVLSCAPAGNGCVRISVFNTGEHISDEDLPEIWDSFYRADKAHNRNSNRFGLGLSIVKSIMTNHKCACGAENVENGVRFYFDVPMGPDYYETD